MLVDTFTFHFSLLLLQGCGSGGTEPAFDFKIVADTVDGSRAVTANMIGAFGGNMSDILDLQVGRGARTGGMVLPVNRHSWLHV